MHAPPCGVFTTTWQPFKTCVCGFFTTTWWHPKAQGSAPTPQGVGAEPWGACGVEQAPQRGATRPTWPHPNASPHARPPFQPADESGRVLWATAFCSTPLGLRSPNRRRPRVRLPGPRGRGAAPWALECHHVVVKRCTRPVVGGHQVAAMKRQRCASFWLAATLWRTRPMPAR